MRSQRRLAIINYVMGICAAAFALLDYSSLSDVRNLIEVHGWHRCWLYHDFHTYVTFDFLVYSVLAAAFLLSWILLGSTYLKLVYLVLGAAGALASLYMWVGWDCTQ